MNSKDTLQVLISPKDLVLTREDLDEKKVAKMTEGLKNGTLLPEELTTPLITPIEGSGYKVGDGNHSVKAMQNADIKQVEAEVYKIK